jgi:hypothetical protein
MLLVDAKSAISILYSVCAVVLDVSFYCRYNPSTALLYFNAYIADADATTLGANRFSNFVKIMYIKQIKRRLLLLGIGG